MSVDIRVPALGESIVEATVGRWLKQEGEVVSGGEPVVELETEKVNVEVPAPEGGVLQSIARLEGETVSIGDVLGVLNEGQAAAASVQMEQSTPPTEATRGPASSTAVEPPNAAAARTPPTPTGGGAADAARATPLARRIAEENGVDLSLVRGSGPSGRVRRDDVTAFIESQSRQAAPAQSQAQSAPVLSIQHAETGRPEERVRMSRRRMTIARRLVEAQRTAAMLTTFNEVDMSAVMEVRRRRVEAFKERHGVRLGFMSFFTKAVVGALKAYPRLNAEIQADEMVLKRYYDIGVAVGAEEGLVVPVIRDADRLSFAEIERQIGELAEKARQKQLTLEDLQGGTFTISNGGIYGSLLSTPILNAPQVGILGMHKIEERPIALNGEVVIRPMMYLALSYDHRIVDGSEAVRFLVRVKELVEDPESLLLEG